ncbi:MAG: radical SAM protein [Phycisphaerales bacterium]|nr:radical SAM protein [Phycisphaerales bacterium]
MLTTRVRYTPELNNFPNPSSNRRNNLFHYYKNPAYAAAADEAHRPDFPFVCSFEFTNRCNLDCVFCARQVMTRKLGYMDEPLLHKMMDEFAQHGTFLKVNGYGEPLLHPRALDFIRHIKKTNGLYFTTNATLIDERVAECFVEANLDVAQISFQGVDREGYESQRLLGEYDRLFDNVRTLVAVRGDNPYPYIHLSTTILDETTEQIEAFMEAAFDAGVDMVGVGRTDYDRVVADMVTDPDRKRLIERFRERQTLDQVSDHTYLYRYIDINYSGVVVSSFFDFNEFLPVGDMNTQSMHDIWNNSAALRALRILERRGGLNGYAEIRDAVRALDQAGHGETMSVFDTFYHAWKLGGKSYNT